MPVPHFTVFDASRGADNVVDEQEDYLEINGVRIQKPLVEKPVSGEDHNVYIYYPRSLGGGSKRLFRKVGDRSSQFYPEEHLTRIHDGGSYIYEELLQTEVRNSDAILTQFCAILAICCRPIHPPRAPTSKCTRWDRSTRTPRRARAPSSTARCCATSAARSSATR